MTNELQIFNNPQFGEIRAIEKDGEPWFVAADVCATFGETNRNRAMKALDDDEKGYTQMTTPGGIQELAIVSESGLYQLLFAMQPGKARNVSNEYIEERKKQLSAFKRWITHEVIPSIRKTGQYSIAPKDYPSALRALADEAEKRMALEAENQIMQPKAAYFDMLIDREMTTPISYVADEFNLSQNKFIQWLINKRILYRAHTIDKDKAGSLKAYQPYIEDGWFEVKDTPYNRSGGTTLQTRFTQKGKQAIRLMLETPGTREAIESTPLPNREKGRKKK